MCQIAKDTQTWFALSSQRKNSNKTKGSSTNCGKEASQRVRKTVTSLFLINRVPRIIILFFCSVERPIYWLSSSPFDFVSRRSHQSRGNDGIDRDPRHYPAAYCHVHYCPMRGRNRRCSTSLWVSGIIFKCNVFLSFFDLNLHQHNLSIDGGDSVIRLKCGGSNNKIVPRVCLSTRIKSTMRPGVQVLV